jgi:hypothetical protein
MRTVVYDVEALVDAGMSAGDVARVMPKMLTGILWADDLTAGRDGAPKQAAGWPEGCRWTMPVTMGSGLIISAWLPSISGRVEPVGKRLSVVQTAEGHEEVSRFLAALRAAVEAGPQDGITAHPLQPGEAYPGPVGNGITGNPPWQVVVYNVAPLTEVGHEPARLGQAIRNTVRPSDWEPVTFPRLRKGGIAFNLPLPPSTGAIIQFGGLSHPALKFERQGRIEPLGKTLVVYQARFVQESIESFLQELQRSHRAPAAEHDAKKRPAT